MKHAVKVFVDAFIKKFGTELGTEITHAAFNEWLVEMGEFGNDVTPELKDIFRNRARSRIKLHLRALKSPRWLTVPKDNVSCTRIVTPPTTKELAEQAHKRNKSFAFRRDDKTMKARGKYSTMDATWIVHSLNEAAKTIKHFEKKFNLVVDLCERTINQQAKQIEADKKNLQRLKHQVAEDSPLRAVKSDTADVIPIVAKKKLAE